MLEVKDLAKRFGGLRAVDGCTLRVEAGTITGLIGPNGAGKSTLFHLITGFLRPDKGHVFFEGREITGFPPHRVFHLRLCRTFQIPREFREMSVLENLMLVPAGQCGEKFWNPLFFPRLVRRQERMIRDKALAVLEFVDLIHLKDELARNLSGGQKKLLELARALMSDPRMMLLDEPGAGVNPTLMRKLAAYIRRLCEERGITVFLIEHDMDMVMSLCNPIIVMSEGRVLMEGSPAAVCQDARVLDAYLGGQYAAT